MGIDGVIVSIVMPTYNGAKYIQRSIDSCLNQTFKKLELIIIDDGSEDNTSDIIASYKDKRLKYLRHETNKGLPCSLNTGFLFARGKYLTWTSDDNFYAENAIEKMVALINEKKCDFVYCDYYCFKTDEPSKLSCIKLPNQVRLENYNCIGACFLYSKKVKMLIGDYNPDAELSEDYDYWIRVSKKFTMSHLNEPLYFFRIHDNSLTSSRYYEIRVTSLLVRLNNNILDITKVSNLFLDFIAQKNKGLFRVNRMLIKFFFAKKIKDILIDFKMKKISFKKAKCKLYTIVNNKLIEHINTFIPHRLIHKIKRKTGS